MDKKNIIIVVVVAVVFAGGGFFGGYKYAQGKRTAQLSAFRNGSGVTAGANGAGRPGRGAAGGGFSGGQIVSKDDKSITLKTMNGGSMIVFLGSSTTVGKATAGTPDDLVVGKNVTVNGTMNSDGSLTASNIQIRPDMPTNPATAQ